MRITMSDDLQAAMYKLPGIHGEPLTVVVRSIIRQHCEDMGLLAPLPNPGTARAMAATWGAYGLTRGIGPQKAAHRVQGDNDNDTD